jgi:hypothetical protein
LDGAGVAQRAQPPPLSKIEVAVLLGVNGILLLVGFRTEPELVQAFFL